MKVFVSVFGKTKNELLTMIKNSRDLTNNFELRFDLCGDWKFTEKNLRELFPKDAQVIFTNRSNDLPLEKGGRGDFFAGFELIDFDLNSPHPNLLLEGEENKENNFLISAHIFEKFSREKTEETINKLLQITAKFHKLAVNLDSAEDLFTFYNLIKKLDHKKWILAGMGEFGKISRVIFEKEGFYTFAGVKNHEVAPGQIDLETLKTLLS